MNLKHMGLFGLTIVILITLVIPVSAKTAGEIYERLRPSVICIVGELDPVFITPEYDSCQGTGFILQPNGVAITTAHNIENTLSLSVYYWENIAGTFSLCETTAEVLAVNSELDLALIDIAGNDFTAVTLAEKPVLITDEVMALSVPYAHVMSMSLFFTEGHVISLTNSILGLNDMNNIISDAFITYGSSGGPLLNSDGDVVGLVYAMGQEDLTGMTFITPINYIYVWSGTPPELGLQIAIDAICGSEAVFTFSDDVYF